jgi:hypothetical protein
MKADRTRDKSAGLFNPGPQTSYRSKLRDCQKLVRVGDEKERQPTTRRVEIVPAFLEGAQIGHATCEHEGQFLRFGAARIVHDPAVAKEDPTRKTIAAECMRSIGGSGRNLLPGRGESAKPGKGTYRVETEVDRKIPRRVTPASSQRGHQGCDLPATPPGIQPKMNKIEHDTGKDPIEVIDRPGNHALLLPGRACLEGQHQGIRAAFEVRERKRIRIPDNRMINSLSNPPGTGDLSDEPRHRR